MEMSGVTFLVMPELQYRRVRFQSGEDFPSWVANLTRPSSFPGIQLRQPDLGRYRRECGEFQVCSCSADPNVLGLYGVVIDEITHIKWKIPFDQSPTWYFCNVKLRGVFISLCQFVQASLDLILHKPWDEAIAMTLACGQTLQNTDASKDVAFKSAMCAWLNSFAWNRSLADTEWQAVAVEEAMPMLEAVLAAYPERAFYISRTGFIGMCHPESSIRDNICHVLGGPHCVVLRHEGEAWRFIGDAYVHELAEVSQQWCYFVERITG